MKSFHNHVRVTSAFREIGDYRLPTLGSLANTWFSVEQPKTFLRDFVYVVPTLSNWTSTDTSQRLTLVRSSKTRQAVDTTYSCQTKRSDSTRTESGNKYDMLFTNCQHLSTKLLAMNDTILILIM